MTTLHSMFEQSTDGVFGIDVAGRVRFANAALERLLGYSCERMRDSECAAVLCGIDLHGRTFCGKDCPVPKTAGSSPPYGDFDLLVRRADGERVLVNIGACYTPRELHRQAGQVNVFFSLRRVNPHRLLQRMATQRSDSPPGERPAGRNQLTGREAQILGLAARGMTTEQLAERLFISTQTVRSHMKNIYQKIGVHNRTEAVLFALQEGLH